MLVVFTKATVGIAGAEQTPSVKAEWVYTALQLLYQEDYSTKFILVLSFLFFSASLDAKFAAADNVSVASTTKKWVYTSSDRDGGRTERQ